MKMFLTMIFAFVTTFFSMAALAGPMIGGELTTHEFTYDFAKSGGAVGFIDLSAYHVLPIGAIVVDGLYMVQTAFTSGGAATVALGDSTTANQFLNATAYNNAAYSANTPASIVSGAPEYVSTLGHGKIGITVAGAALTAGKMKIILKVYKPKQ